VGKFLEEEVGIETSREAIDITITGSRFHLIHGDGIAKGDYSYRLLRRIVRLPLTESLYKLVHPDLGIWFADKLSDVSREQISSRTIWVADSYREYASHKLDEGVNFVVMGHRHEAEWIAHANGGFLAVGDWIRKGSYGVFENGKLELKYFPDLPTS
jgi:UDP-2,3-diacylglucosamine hydrolase